MKPATPVQMRDSLKLVQALKEGMIHFVPIPVLNDEDFLVLTGLLTNKLNIIFDEVEDNEK